jgi:hypothetical protein
MTPKALKVHLKHIKALKINSFVASIPSMFHNGMGVMINRSPEFFKRESLCRQSSTTGLGIESY